MNLDKSTLIPSILCIGFMFLFVLERASSANISPPTPCQYRGGAASPVSETTPCTGAPTTTTTTTTTTTPTATASSGGVGMLSEGIRNAYIDLMKSAVTGSLFDEMGACVMGSAPNGCGQQKPYDHQLRLRGGDWPYVGHTMVGHMRLDNIRMALEDVIKNNVPGDFLEMGVWRGGACAFARAVLNAYGQSERSVHLFDAFESIAGYGSATQFLAVTQKQVEHTLEKYNLTEGTYSHKGLFKDTVPSFSKSFTGQIAVLRIDGNYYDSYQDAMYYLYDKVPVGGYVIFDDIISHPAVQRMWGDFKREQGVPEEITPIDKDAAFFKKTSAITTDFKFFRAPQDANK